MNGNYYVPPSIPGWIYILAVPAAIWVLCMAIKYLGGPPAPKSGPKNKR